MEKSILVIAPHCDDAELGLGAYLHAQAKKGAHIAVVVLAAGETLSTHHKATVDLTMRRREGEAAAEILGVRDYRFIEAAMDTAFNMTPRGQFVQVIERLVFNRNLDELFIPLPSFHEDHVATYEACVAALRPHIGRQYPRAVYAYEYPGQCWGPQNQLNGRVYHPATGEDLEAKLAALAAHVSQCASIEESLFGKRGVRALAELRGAEIGVLAAECFYLMRATLG